MVIFQDPSAFYVGQMCELNAGILTPMSFKSLRVALISAFPPGVGFYFGVSVFLGKGISSGFYLFFSLHHSPHSTFQTTSVVILSGAEHIYSSFT
jgi:hypothetical protein